MQDVEEEATFLQADVIRDISERNRRNEQLMQRSLQQQAASASTITAAELEVDDIYDYKHDLNGPLVAATAIIRPQSGIADWIVGFSHFLKLKKDMVIVVQTLRYTKEEADLITIEQKRGSMPVRWPPNVQDCKLMTMQERALEEPSQIGCLRITTEAAATDLQLFPDAIIPCFFASETHPVVGLGPAVTVDCANFLWHLQNMLQNMVANNAEQGFLNFDHRQIIFGFQYTCHSSKSSAVEQSTGTYVEAPSLKQRQVTYLNYNHPMTDESGNALYTSNSFSVKTRNTALVLDDWYTTKWESDELIKCIKVLRQPQQGGASSAGSESNSGAMSCNLDISHDFIPPAKYRDGWKIDTFLPTAVSFSTTSQWWGFVESLRLNVCLDLASHVLSEQVLYRAIGPNNIEMWNEMPDKPVDRYVEHIAKSLTGGVPEAIQILSRLKSEFWPSDHASSRSDLAACVVPTMRINLATLQACLLAAKFKNCKLSSRHSRLRSHAAIVMLYQYDNEMPNANKAKHDQDTAQNDLDGGKSYRVPASIVSTYLMRPVTMSILATTTAVDPPKARDANGLVLDPSKYAPNNVEWKTLMPDIDWAQSHDDMTIVSNETFVGVARGGRRVLSESMERDIQAGIDFGDMHDEDY